MHLLGFELFLDSCYPPYLSLCLSVPLKERNDAKLHWALFMDALTSIISCQITAVHTILGMPSRCRRRRGWAGVDVHTDRLVSVGSTYTFCAFDPPIRLHTCRSVHICCRACCAIRPTGG